MKAKPLLLFLILMASTQIEATANLPSPNTMKTLVDRLQESVGSGWTVTYDTKLEVITISRNELAAVSYVVPNPPAPSGAGDCGGEGEKDHFVFSVSVEPLIPQSEYNRLKHENDLIEKRQSELEKELRKSGINVWVPSEDGGISGHSDDPQVEAKIEEYNSLNKKFTRLPDGYFRDVSASWRDWGGSSEVADSPKVQRECDEVSNRFTKVFTEYSTAP